MLTFLAVCLLVIYGLLEGVRTRILNRIGLEFDELMSGRVFNSFEMAVRNVAAPAQIIRDTDSVREFIADAIVAFCDAP